MPSVFETSVQQLAEILGCTVCKSPLSPSNAGSMWVCAKCQLYYRVENGIIIALTGEEGDAVQKAKDDWDKDAMSDHVRSATATSKECVKSVFVKLPPLPPRSVLQSRTHLDLGCGYGRTLTLC
jgi:uncharacterized protein YbaR (Trm112 family)